MFPAFQSVLLYPVTNHPHSRTNGKDDENPYRPACRPENLGNLYLSDQTRVFRDPPVLKRFVLAIFPQSDSSESTNTCTYGENSSLSLAGRTLCFGPDSVRLCY